MIWPEMGMNLYKLCGCFCLALLLGTNAGAFERRTPVVAAIEKAGPAVVNIRTEQVVKGRRSLQFGFGDSIFEEFFRDFAPPQVYRSQSLGSGVIIDPRGFVLTNAHVIEQASKIFLAVPGQRQELEGELVGADERLDIAVVKIKAGGTYPYLPPGRSGALLLGETVIAIGNPLGLGHSVTTGVVSAALRRVPMGDGSVAHFLQTDALINPGNSGGPLLNVNGELIGINTAIARQAQGIGFAIPIDQARRVAGDLIRYGRRRPVWFGIIPGEVNPALVRSRGAGGVLVTEVEKKSPAAAAGLQIADVVLTVDGEVVESPAELMLLLASYTPDDRVRVRILRGTGESERTLALSSLPKDYGLRYGEQVFGFTVQRGPHGLAVGKVVPDGPADKVGLRSGDLVKEVGGQQVGDPETFGRYLEEQLHRLPMSFLFVRGNRGYQIQLP
jgi:serine protease Do